jgi:hypothetical protein
MLSTPPAVRAGFRGGRVESSMRAMIETWFLEMTSPGDLRPFRPRAEGFRVEQARIPTPELNHFLYTAVGGDWYWIDRLEWTHAQWLA